MVYDTPMIYQELQSRNDLKRVAKETEVSKEDTLKNDTEYKHLEG